LTLASLVKVAKRGRHSRRSAAPRTARPRASRPSCSSISACRAAACRRSARRPPRRRSRRCRCRSRRRCRSRSRCNRSDISSRLYDQSHCRARRPAEAQGEGRVDAVGVDVADIDEDRGAAGDAAAGDAARIGRDRQQAVVEHDVVIVDLRLEARSVAEAAAGAQAAFVGPAALGLALVGEGVERRLAAGEPGPPPPPDRP
jgi:hypothetical protein